MAIAGPCCAGSEVMLNAGGQRPADQVSAMSLKSCVLFLEPSSQGRCGSPELNPLEFYQHSTVFPKTVHKLKKTTEAKP